MSKEVQNKQLIVIKDKENVMVDEWDDLDYDQKKLYRNYMLTCNNYTEKDILLFQEVTTKYKVFGKEIGEKNKVPHLQCFVHFENGKSKARVINLYPRFHVMICKFPERAILYCKKGLQSKEEWLKSKNKGLNYGKNADIFEEGEFMTQKMKGNKGKEYWDNVKEKVESDKVEDLEYEFQFRNHNALEYMQHKYKMKRKLKSLDVLDNEWYWGPTGANKSRFVREKYPDAYIKLPNEWWCGYSDEETVIIEDFDIDDYKLVKFLKIWADHYACKVNVKKWGAIMVRPSRIIITSNWEPKEIWKNSKDYEPILRRFKIIHKQISTYRII